jgi:hypothetical protein
MSLLAADAFECGCGLPAPIANAHLFLLFDHANCYHQCVIDDNKRRPCWWLPLRVCLFELVEYIRDYPFVLVESADDFTRLSSWEKLSEKANQLWFKRQRGWDVCVLSCECDVIATAWRENFL